MHLRRVQISAMAVGRELKLSEPELEALNISAMLHDIGKLGIPDHILLKPGSLTAQEWEKMKTHALIGADMLARMHFPELVSDIVKAHHEKWDGSGYPRGLKETEIPIGARILSAVDCLDALASDRPYRAALPLDEAMDMVRRQSGKSYDPAIIAILEQKYIELDRMARGTAGDPPPHSQTASPGSPAEGITNLASRLQTESKATPEGDILEPIVSARQETQLLRALAADLAQSTHLDRSRLRDLQVFEPEDSLRHLGAVCPPPGISRTDLFPGRTSLLVQQDSLSDQRRTFGLGCSARTPDTKRERVDRMLLCKRLGGPEQPADRAGSAI